MIIEIIASALTSVSFGILFNIRGKRLIAAGIGGAITWLVYKTCIIYGSEEVTANFMAAVFFSIYCEICAIIYKTPATTLTVCCLIPLVPGYGVYNTMYEFIVGDYMKFIEYGVDTLSVAGALALGVIFISTTFRDFKIHNILNNIIENIKKNINNRNNNETINKIEKIT